MDNGCPFVNNKGKIDFNATHFYHLEDGCVGKLREILVISEILKFKERPEGLYYDLISFEQQFVHAFCFQWLKEGANMFKRTCKGTCCKCDAPDRKLYKVQLKNVNKQHLDKWEIPYHHNFARGDILFSEEKNAIRLSGDDRVMTTLEKIREFFQAGFCDAKYIQKKILINDLILIPDNVGTLFGNMFSKKETMIEEWGDIYPCYIHSDQYNILGL